MGHIALESIVAVADRCKGHWPMLGRNSTVIRPDIFASIYTVRSCHCTAFSKLYPHDLLLTYFLNRMPKLVKESDGDEKNCDKERQQPPSSQGKGQKTLAVKTRKSHQKRIHEEKSGASGTEGGAIRYIRC